VIQAVGAGRLLSLSRLWLGQSWLGLPDHRRAPGWQVGVPAISRPVSRLNPSAGIVTAALPWLNVNGQDRPP
jgi:hypothetical protein